MPKGALCLKSIQGPASSSKLLPLMSTPSRHKNCKSPFDPGVVMISKFLVPLLLLITLASAAHGAPTCSQLFSPSFLGVPSQSAVQELTDLMTQDLRKQSDLLIKNIKSQGGQVHVKKLVIGAGLHGAIFAANAGRNNRGNDVLVIEGGNMVSKVFGEMAGTFNINSAETQDSSANVFPGSAIEMKDLTSVKNSATLNIEDVFYADSGKMAALATSTMYGSGLNLLFGNKAVEITYLGGKTKTGERYLVKTSMGIEIYVNEIVFSTGLGDPSVPLKDLNTRALVESYIAASDKDPGRIFPVMSVDSFLRSVRISRANADSTIAKVLRGKTVAVIGKGDGGKIVVERLVKFSDVHIKWLGQDAKNPDEYRASTWSRYFTIAENIGRDIETFPGHVQQVIALPSGKIKIILVDGTETLADITLLATGYKSVVPDLLSHLEPGGATHDIALEPLKNLNQVIGSRVMIDGHPTEGLYVAGPAAGMLASPEQMAASATGNPVSVNVMGQFTQALANHLLPMARKIS
jgi:hypothetical protein